MLGSLAARGIRARNPEVQVGAIDAFDKPRLALTFTVMRGGIAEQLTLFAYGCNVFAVTDGADFVYVDNDEPNVVRRIQCATVVRTELNRALSNVQPSIGLPLDGQGEPLYNLVYRPYDELESILVPHLGSPRVYPSTPAMAAFIDGAVRHVVEERPVELSDGLLRRHDGELLSEYVRRLLA